MGIRVYDPSGRRTQRRRSPFTPQNQPAPRTAADEGTRPANSIKEFAIRNSAGVKERPAKPKEDKGLGESFFGTSIGGALGTVLNNRVVKSVLQPLDILGVPGRAIGSAIQEGADLISGNGDASLQEFYDQTNPFFFAHGNESGTEWGGLGDTWQRHGKALGAGKNRYVDAAVGFAGDVATDPLTYVGGIGVVDKGLDGLRSGSRLSAAVKSVRAAGGGDEGKVLEMALDKVNKVRDGVDPATFVNRSKGKGSRASLTGRPARTRRTSQAQVLVDNADAEMLDFLYGGVGLKERALVEIQHQAGAGLGAFSKGIKADDPLRELVETALNIKPAAARARVPFARQQGKAVIGTEGLSRGAGKVRQEINSTRFGQKMIDAKSPLDEELAMRIIAQGGDADPAEFARASRHIESVEGTRATAGEYLVEGLNMARGQRKLMNKEIRTRAGGDAKEYIKIAETEGGTILNNLFEMARTKLADRHGVTIPDLAEGGLNYLPHSFSPEFRRFLQTTKGQTFADDLVARFGGTIEQDLLKESGRLSGRNIGPDMDLPLPGGAKGEVFNTGDGSIDAINNEVAKRMKDAGVKPIRVLEDSPMKMIDDYIQAVSEDVGRRVSRADQIAKGNPDLRYNAGDPSDPSFQQRADEAFLEQRKASDRLELNETDDQIIERLSVQGDEVLDSQRAAEASKASYDEAVMANRQLEDATDAITFEDVDGIIRVLGTEELPKLVDDAFAKWKRVGANDQAMMTPEADDLWRNVRKVIADPGMLMKVYRELNKYFKNFAVLTPGFHVRNGLSAIFMNIADGVPLQTTYRGIKLWKRFSRASKDGRDMEGGMKFIDALENPNERAALRSVFGSGAGGRFTEAGQAQGAVNKASRFLTENRLTRGSQDAGAFVEGSVRLGMALDAIEAGGSMADAVNRITRVQFDYSQTSRTDDTMKQIMPFYSFMSRNIPLQIMQQWSRPQAYVAYEHIKNNFAQPEVFEGREGEIPGYIEDGGGMPMNLGPFGNRLEPDLPHTRVGEDIERYMNILNDPLGATSGMSPVITAPLEFGFKQDAFTGQRFEDDDLEHVSNPLEMLAIIPAWATKTLKMKDGEMFIEKRTLNALQAIDPLFSRASRLTGSGGQESARTIEAIQRTMGVPTRNITPKQMENAARGERFDEADRRAVDQAMERALRGN